VAGAICDKRVVDFISTPAYTFTRRFEQEARVANLPKHRIDIDKKYFTDAFANAGVSQNDVAARLGIDKSSMSLVMHGRRKMTLAEASGIASIIGATLDKVVDKSGALRSVIPDAKRRR
jgi:ribosome-binding protein aMBF1 (putative translation factor)